MTKQKKQQQQAPPAPPAPTPEPPPVAPPARVPGRAEDDIYVAIESFACEIDGSPVFVTAGERVRKGHALLRDQAARFQPVDLSVQYDIEQATAAPGERRER